MTAELLAFFEQATELLRLVLELSEHVAASWDTSVAFNGLKLSAGAATDSQSE